MVECGLPEYESMFHAVEVQLQGPKTWVRVVTKGPNPTDPHHVFRVQAWEDCCGCPPTSKDGIRLHRKDWSPALSLAMWILMLAYVGIQLNRAGPASLKRQAALFI